MAISNPTIDASWSSMKPAGASAIFQPASPFISRSKRAVSLSDDGAFAFQVTDEADAAMNMNDTVIPCRHDTVVCQPCRGTSSARRSRPRRKRRRERRHPRRSPDESRWRRPHARSACRPGPEASECDCQKTAGPSWRPAWRAGIRRRVRRQAPASASMKWGGRYM